MSLITGAFTCSNDGRVHVDMSMYGVASPEGAPSTTHAYICYDMSHARAGQAAGFHYPLAEVRGKQPSLG